jgi:hypothetical protein
VRTAKNAQVADLYPRLGFRPVPQRGPVDGRDGGPPERTEWEAVVAELPASPGFIRVESPAASSR